MIPTSATTKPVSKSGSSFSSNINKFTNDLALVL